MTLTLMFYVAKFVGMVEVIDFIKQSTLRYKVAICNTVAFVV